MLTFFKVDTFYRNNTETYHAPISSLNYKTKKKEFTQKNEFKTSLQKNKEEKNKELKK